MKSILVIDTPSSCSECNVGEAINKNREYFLELYNYKYKFGNCSIKDCYLNNNNTIKQVLSDKDKRIEEYEAEQNLFTIANRKLQSKLNAIEEVVSKELNNYFSLEGSEVDTLIKIEKIIGGK